MSHTILLPRFLEVGKNAREKIPHILKSLGCNKPLIITDQMMVKLGYIADIQKILKSENIEADFFDQTIPEPTSSSIEAGFSLFKHINMIQLLLWVAVVQLTVQKPLAS